MPSCPLSTLLPPRLPIWCQTFFKSKRLPQFSCDLSDIWLEYAEQYCPNLVELDFSSNCLMDFILQKICKNGNFGSFWPFFQKP